MQFLRLLMVVGIGALAAGPAAAAADFYQGKTLTVIVGYAPGGGVDTTARAVTRHLGRFIPGNPAVTVQNMEGAAGIVSVNHLVRRVAPDGLTLGIPGRSWFVEGIVKRPGIAFDPVTLTYIGSPGSVTSAAFVRTAHRDQDLRRAQGVGASRSASARSAPARTPRRCRTCWPPPARRSGSCSATSRPRASCWRWSRARSTAPSPPATVSPTVRRWPSRWRRSCSRRRAIRACR